MSDAGRIPPKPPPGALLSEDPEVRARLREALRTQLTPISGQEPLRRALRDAVGINARWQQLTLGEVTDLPGGNLKIEVAVLGPMYGSESSYARGDEVFMVHARVAVSFTSDGTLKDAKVLEVKHDHDKAGYALKGPISYRPEASSPVASPASVRVEDKAPDPDPAARKKRWWHLDIFG